MKKYVAAVLVGFAALAACGGEDYEVVEDEESNTAWIQVNDPWTGESFNCVVIGLYDSIWCHD